MIASLICALYGCRFERRPFEWRIVLGHRVVGFLPRQMNIGAVLQACRILRAENLHH